ncbi:MAG: TolC family protein [Verrucomicrobiota bacterium]
MRTVILIGLLMTSALVGLADEVEAQVRARQQTRQGETERMLSLEDCIKIALEHNFSVQISRLDPQVAGFQLKGSYAGYDPTFSLSARHSYDMSPGGLDSQGRVYSGTESETDSYAGTIGGLLPWGTRYSFGANLSDRTGTQPGTTVDLNNPLSIYTNQYYDLVANAPVSQLVTNYATVPNRNPFEYASANVGFFELRQPLLKDFWIDGTRFQVFVSKKNLQSSELGLRGQIIDTITLVEQAYYNYIYAVESVGVQEKALELAERLVAENRRRVEVGALAPLDEKQAESEAASRRADLLEAQANRDTQQRVLKALLSDDYQEWKSVRIRPLESLQAIPQPLDLQESWRKGVSTRPDLLQARVAVEVQDKRVKYQRNQRFPQLDVVGDVGYVGSDNELNGAWSQVRNRDNSYYSYGVQLTVPLGNVGARNEYKAALSTREQRELEVRQLEQSVLIQIENSIANARTSLERVEATRQARAYAEEALKAEEMKLAKGKSTSFVVLDLQGNLTAARSAEIRALADYNISLAQLAKNEGSTLERRGVELKLR